MKVKDARELFVEEPTTIRSDASLKELLAKIIEDLRTRNVYVVDSENRLLGSVRMNAVVEYLFPFEAVVESIGKSVWSKLPRLGAEKLGDLMIRQPPFVYETTTLRDMARIMIREKVYELAVVDTEKRLIGQINMYEIIKKYLEESG